MTLLRFRCKACGLEMALPDKPDKCFCCGSCDIVREGWKLRSKKMQEDVERSVR